MITSEKTKTVISLSDHEIRYVTIAKNKKGFYIKKFDSAELEEGIIKDGEILKADFLRKILLNIAKKINSEVINLLLPHHHFSFDTHTINKEEGLTNLKLFKKYIKEQKKNIPWAATHSYEYELFENEKQISILFSTLRRETYSAYDFIFKKVGLKINSVSSDILAFSPLLSQTERVTQIYVDQDYSYVIEYKNGLYMNDRKFQLSRNQLLDDIKKNIQINDVEAKKILEQYGVLRTHKDSKVLARMERSMSPLFEFITKRKIKEKSSVVVHFSDTPILGFVDKVSKITKTDVSALCSLKSPMFPFHEVITLHKKKSYVYEPLVARALSLF